MMEWVLPTPMQRGLHDACAWLEEEGERGKQCLQFMRGGFWRGFLAKYPESNNIQKRMLRTSRRFDELRVRMAGDERLEEAQRLLHEGQCNCAYWHGVFGGLYLNHLRTALYERLIAADREMDAIAGYDARWVRSERTDFDGDGNDEAVLDTASLTAFFSPADGGTLFELDYKPKPFNFCNTLARREEAYHAALREGRVTVGDEEDAGKSIHELVKAKEKHPRYAAGLRPVPARLPARPLSAAGDKRRGAVGLRSPRARGFPHGRLRAGPGRRKRIA